MLVLICCSSTALQKNWWVKLLKLLPLTVDSSFCKKDPCLQLVIMVRSSLQAWNLKGLAVTATAMTKKTWMVWKMRHNMLLVDNPGESLIFWTRWSCYGPKPIEQLAFLLSIFCGAFFTSGAVRWACHELVRKPDGFQCHNWDPQYKTLERLSEHEVVLWIDCKSLPQMLSNSQTMPMLFGRHSWISYFIRQSWTDVDSDTSSKLARLGSSSTGIPCLRCRGGFRGRGRRRLWAGASHQCERHGPATHAGASCGDYEFKDSKLQNISAIYSDLLEYDGIWRHKKKL